ncbi:MAG: hypothetical protein JHC31_06600 [Sulfurihydrogenibium sp.]|jgi:hypothetical protein|nr:hypothetical protein [Sulfurihydrogenibium sp.]
MKITVDTAKLKESLKILNDSLKKGYSLFMWFDNALKLRVNDPRFHYVREIEIEPITLEKDSNDPFLISLDSSQVRELKKSIRYYKQNLTIIEVKENENYEKHLPRVLRYKLVVNGTEIEVN